MKLLIFFTSLLIVICFVHASWNSVCNITETMHSCRVRLPRNDRLYHAHCATLRNQQTNMQRQYFKLTTPIEVDAVNADHTPIFPRLDQNLDVISAKAMFGDQDAKWFSNYYGMIRAFNDTAKTLMGMMKTNPMKDYKDYKTVYHAFLDTVKKIQQFSPKHFSLPSQSPHFTDIISNEKWEEDKYFVQRRLAGQCPYFLRRVTRDTKIGFHFETLKNMASYEFDWNKHVLQKYGKGINKLVSEKRVFILYHEHYNKLPHTVDILDVNPNDNVQLEKTKSPISIFVLNDHRDLEIFAIQIDSSKRDSPVFTPNGSTPLEWMKAKGHAEIVEMATCQLIGHLLETHSTQEVFCNLFPRHFGELHPLHQLMTPHCQGTSPVGGLGLSALLDVERYMHRLFSIGYLGSRKYVNEYYKEQDYADADFEYQLKKNGLDDENLIKYHPYREDGKIIWKEIKKFVKQYVKLYYKSNEDVIYDDELQGFVNELSAAGSIQQGGGKYKGFPKNFTSCKDLETFLTRFIWLPVKHAANSYPLVPYGAYVPVAPTKLYSDPSDTKAFAHNLPNVAIALTQEVLTFTLASFRVNRLFDYSKLLSDNKARCLVKSTHTSLNSCVQKKLEEANKKRFDRGDLTYQYMEPKWLPNSIHN